MEIRPPSADPVITTGLALPGSLPDPARTGHSKRSSSAAAVSVTATEAGPSVSPVMGTPWWSALHQTIRRGTAISVLEPLGSSNALTVLGSNRAPNWSGLAGPLRLMGTQGRQSRRPRDG